MKKFLSMILALCLMLAMVPSLAEDDLSGTWYLLMMGMTGGTFELNADGTCIVTSSMNGEEARTEGTWAADGSTVTITINGTDMPLTYNGTDLVLGEEAFAAFGDAGAPAGMDISAMGSMIRISREPGKVTADEFSAYQADGTLPEGKTREEMDLIQAEMMVSALGVLGSMDLSSAGTGAGEGLPLSVLEENFYVRESYGGREGYYIARVQNTNDVPLYISEASLVLKDADGNEAGKSEYLGESGSRYLEPGEISFVSMTADIEESTAEVSCEAVLRTSAESYFRDSVIEVSGTELRLVESFSTDYYAAGTITNTGEEPLSQVNIIFAVRDADGKLLGLASAGLYRNELAAGSTITLLDSIDSRIVEYVKANNLTLSEEIEAFAWKDLNS